MFERMREDIAVIQERDPAARSALEVMLLYNGFKAIRAHRKANWFYRHRMKFIARWISQRCVRRTNIEIHLPKSAAACSSTTAPAWSSGKPPSSATTAPFIRE